MINNELAQFVKEAFLQKGYDLNGTEIRVTESNLPNLCDYQCNNAFEIAKKAHKNPFEIAFEISEILNENKKIFSKAEAYKPGFINLTLSEEFLNKNLNNMFNKEKFGFEMPEKQKLFVVDYGGPNIAKPLHVGHLRSPVIGESLKRIIQYEGHKTISDIHFGDFGLQIGMVIFGLKERGLRPTDITLELLTELYPQINSRAKEDLELNKICADITKQLQDGNKEYREYWKVIRKISAEDILSLYKYLGISFDLYEGESNAYDYIDDLTKLLNEKNLIETSNGAKIIEIKEPTDSKEFPPLIYQKSNGAYLYGTTDMATVYERVKLFNPDHIIYIADLRQQLHFLQFFRAIAKTGIIKLEQLEFHGLGTVNDINGQPLKTRAGGTPKLKDLLKDVKEVLKANKEILEQAKEEDVDKIVNAVIKFADLQNNRERDYIMDLERFSKIDGKTGPYILYSYLRIKKLIETYEKLDIKEIKTSSYNGSERKLKLQLVKLEANFKKSFKERRPNYIADYIYELCCNLNSFYEQNRFNDMNNESKINSWLFEIKLSLKILKEMLHLLIIEIPSKM